MGLLASLMLLAQAPTQLGANSLQLVDPDLTPVSHFRLFGASVACTRFRVPGVTSGYTVVVGAPGDDSTAPDAGAVYLYDSGLLSPGAIPVAVPAAGDQSGQVAVDEDTLAVGAWRAAPTGGTQESGTVQVFERSTGANAWTLARTFDEAEFGTGAMDRIGALDVDDGVLAVGSRLADVGPNVDAGSAWVIERTAGSWSTATVTQLAPAFPLATAGDQFGSVAVSGETVAVGARRMDISPLLQSAPPCSQSAESCQQGAVFLFEKSVPPGWGQQDVVIAMRQGSSGSIPDGASGDEFGFAVAIDGDYLVVGAPGRDVECDPVSVAQETNCDSGAAYVYRRVGTAWEFSQRLLPSDPFAPAIGGPVAVVAPNIHQRFGYSVAAHERRIAIGAPGTLVGQPNGSSLNTGAVFVYERSDDDIWLPTRVLTESDLGLAPSGPDPATGTVGPLFGTSVDVACSLVAVGAPRAESNGLSFAGRAYVFDLLSEPDDSFHPSTCDGDGGDGAGCSDCPCGNNGMPGTLGGCLNSQGTQARLTACGVPSIGADSLRFELEGAGPSVLCLLVSGVGLLPGAGACPPGSGLSDPMTLDGLLCVGQGLTRLGSRVSDGQGAVGVTNSGWGPPDPPASGILALHSAGLGDTRHYQVRYRDISWGVFCGIGLNSSNALTVTAVP